MGKNKQPETIADRQTLNDEVRGGYNSPRYEQKPKPPAKPSEKPKDK